MQADLSVRKPLSVFDAFEAEVAYNDEEPEGDAGPDAPDDAEAGGTAPTLSQVARFL